MTPGRRLRDYVATRIDVAPGSAEFAARVGVTKSAVSEWFRGREPSCESFRRLAAAVGVPRWELIRVWDGE